MTCSAKAPECSLALSPKPMCLPFTYALEKAPLGPSFLRASGKVQCKFVSPVSPFSKGAHLFSCQALPMRNEPVACCAPERSGFLEVSVMESVSRCFAHQMSPWSPAGVTSLAFLEKRMSPGLGRQLRDEGCALGPVPVSSVAWNKLLCLWGSFFPICEMGLLMLTSFTS